jgi:hypothetical protein
MKIFMLQLPCRFLLTHRLPLATPAHPILNQRVGNALILSGALDRNSNCSKCAPKELNFSLPAPRTIIEHLKGSASDKRLNAQ